MRQPGPAGDGDMGECVAADLQLDGRGGEQFWAAREWERVCSLRQFFFLFFVCGVC